MEEKVRICFSGAAEVLVSQTVEIPLRIWEQLKIDSDREVNDYLVDITDWQNATLDSATAVFDDLCVVDEDDRVKEYLRD